MNVAGPKKEEKNVAQEGVSSSFMDHAELQRQIFVDQAFLPK